MGDWVQNKSNSNKVKMEIKYSDVKEVIERELTPKELMKIKERWEYDFYLKTNCRDFELYCASQDERELWLHTFRWICECNAYY